MYVYVMRPALPSAVTGREEASRDGLPTEVKRDALRTFPNVER
jgi:hypothetical protein